VSVTPHILMTAATDLEAVGSSLDVAHLAAAAKTFDVAPAAADEVSASIAYLFSEHAQEYQAVAAQAEAYQEQFVDTLKTGGLAYASAESFNLSLLDNLITLTAAPGAALFLGAILYVQWASSWISAVPPSLQMLAFLPAQLMVLGAFASFLASIVVLNMLSPLYQLSSSLS
jgi:hypothetical protein